MQKTEQQKTENAAKAEKAAKSLYPNEKWEFLEDGIYIAKSRQPQNADQSNILNKELRQARILISYGSTVYLLPEKAPPTERRVKYPDAIVDGNLMEFKTITGSIRQVERRYKKAKEKNTEYIFLLIDTDLTPREVKWKLSGYIKRKGFLDGYIFAYFTKSNEFYYWSEARLASEGNPVSY